MPNMRDEYLDALERGEQPASDGNNVPEPMNMPDPASASASQPAPTNVYGQFKGSNYDDVEKFIREQMKAYTPESDADRRKRERRERRTRSLAALGDVLGSMHKAYSYQRGVQPMELPNLSDRAQARFDKAKAEREKQRDQYMNYALKLGEIKDADRAFNFNVAKAEQDQTNWQQTFDANQAAEAAKEARAAAKEERDIALYRLQAQIQQGKIDEQAYKTQIAQINAKYQARLNQSVLDRNEAAAAASGRSNRGYGSGGSGNGRSLTVGGKTYHYPNDAEWKTAVYKYAKQYNIPVTTKDVMGKESDRNIFAIAGDLANVSGTGGKKKVPGF